MRFPAIRKVDPERVNLFCLRISNELKKYVLKNDVPIDKLMNIE